MRAPILSLGTGSLVLGTWLEFLEQSVPKIKNHENGTEMIEESPCEVEFKLSEDQCGKRSNRDGRRLLNSTNVNVSDT